MGRQIVADVPLCSLLSGGLDSSAITALASKPLLKRGQDNIRFISLDVQKHGSDVVENDFNLSSDTPSVRARVERIGAHHDEVVLDSAGRADPTLCRSVLHALDQPPAFWGDMWPSLYLLFEAVRTRSAVALPGEAADEIFGSYRWFHDPAVLTARTQPPKGREMSVRRHAGARRSPSRPDAGPRFVRSDDVSGRLYQSVLISTDEPSRAVRGT